MKNLALFLFSILAVLYVNIAHSQDAYILIDYMKVASINEDNYLAIEKEWKIVHQKKMDEGMIDGWQLWKKLYAGDDDPYQYITITWYGSFNQTNFKYPENFWSSLMTEEKYQDLYKRTVASRSMSSREVSFRIMQANNATDTKYLIVNRMKVDPDAENEYIDMERNIWKPLHEESIEKGFRTHWSVWETFPYSEGQARFTTIDGFEEFSQIGNFDGMMHRLVHPELSWTEIDLEAARLRDRISTEIWELVDDLFPE